MICDHSEPRLEPETRVNAETPGSSLEVVDPIEVVVDQVTVVEPSQPVTIQNTESLKDTNEEINDLPTFDEALKMEIVKTDNFQSKVKKQRNEELPDYETHESHPIYF